MRRALKDLLDGAIERGWVVSATKKGWCLKFGTVGIYHVHKTNSDFRALTHVEKALTRIEQGRPAGAH